MTHRFAVLVALTFFAACTESSSDGGTACERSARMACEGACACTNPDGMCRIGDRVHTFEFADETACLAFYLDYGCSMPNPGIDFDQCEMALASATCVPDSSGPENQRFDQPGACEVNGGPP